MEIMIALRIAPAAADDEHGQLCLPTASPERQMRKRRAGRTKKAVLLREVAEEAVIL